MRQQDAPTKKERLTLSQLAKYDDILTDTLVDHVCTIQEISVTNVADRLQVYFWTTIRKNRSKYNLTRGISEEHVTAILLADVIVAKDPQKAESALLQLPGLRKYIDGLKTTGEKEHFKRHMRKYIHMWLPDCPFEVSTTNRYTIITQEAATTARRFIKKNEPIRYLCGYLVSMTAEEEQDLDLTRRDFSIVMSSRKKSPSLFLGPARFANHDCNANARLVTQGSDGMQVVAVRDIMLGEEITVTYGENYFGEGNCECLCMTCEKEGRNGWPPRIQSCTSSGTATPLAESEMEAMRPYSFRKTRRPPRFTESPLLRTPDTDHGSPVKRRKVSDGRRASSLSVGIADGQARASVLKTEPSKSTLRHEFMSVGSDPTSAVTAKLRSKDIQQEDVLRASVQAAFASVKNSDNPPKRKVGRPRKYPLKVSQPTLIDAVIPKEPAKAPTLLATPEQTPLELQTPSAPSDVDSIFDHGMPNRSSPATTPSASLDASLDVIESWKPPLTTPDPETESDSDLSELSSHEDLDDTNQTITRKSQPSKPLNPLIKKPKLVPTIEIEHHVAPRLPGDYIRTPLLLGESYSRWVDCRTCASCWVQPNGYLTRKECPRCERHSKLYGYQWPKTEKTGKADDEERVMDHRTVHRFIKPEEEALVKKRGRGVERVVGDGSSERGGSAVVDDAERSVERARRGGKVRGSCLAV